MHKSQEQDSSKKEDLPLLHRKISCLSAPKCQKEHVAQQDWISRISGGHTFMDTSFPLQVACIKSHMQKIKNTNFLHSHIPCHSVFSSRSYKIILHNLTRNLLAARKPNQIRKCISTKSLPSKHSKYGNFQQLSMLLHCHLPINYNNT